MLRHTVAFKERGSYLRILNKTKIQVVDGGKVAIGDAPREAVNSVIVNGSCGLGTVIAIVK